MAAAGLTHGGFYRHFESKEQLVAEACAVSMDELVGAAEIAVEGGDETFLKHVEDFLSAKYRDDRLGGCPLVAMGSELARADADTRRAASLGFQELIDLIAKRSRFKDSESAKADAIFTLSSMIGAVTMSRIVDDPELSDLILESTRTRLIELSTSTKTKRAKAKAA
jgi:TetR/AcrR family transcriptional repressor of nem operon